MILPLNDDPRITLLTFRFKPPLIYFDFSPRNSSAENESVAIESRAEAQQSFILKQ